MSWSRSGRRPWTGSACLSRSTTPRSASSRSRATRARCATAKATARSSSYVSIQAAHAIERRRAEDELRESQRQLSTLMSNLPGMAYRCANDDRLDDGVRQRGLLPPSPATSRRTSSAARRSAYAALIDPADRELVRDAVEDALAARQPFEVSYRIRTARGGQKWVWERGRGVWSDAGELMALEGFIADITERKAAEDALRTQRGALPARAAGHPGDHVRLGPRPPTRSSGTPTSARCSATPMARLGNSAETRTTLLHPDDVRRVAGRSRVGPGRRRGLHQRVPFPQEVGRLRRVLLDRGLILRDPDGTARPHGRRNDRPHRAQAALRTSFARSRRSRRSAGSPAGSPTTSTTCSPPLLGSDRAAPAPPRRRRRVRSTSSRPSTARPGVPPSSPRACWRSPAARCSSRCTSTSTRSSPRRSRCCGA